MHDTSLRHCIGRWGNPWTVVCRMHRGRTTRSPSSNCSQAYSAWAQCSAGVPRPMRALPRMRSYCALARSRCPRCSAILARPRSACCRMLVGGLPLSSSKPLSPSVVQPALAKVTRQDQASSADLKADCTLEGDAMHDSDDATVTACQQWINGARHSASSHGSHAGRMVRVWGWGTSLPGF